MLTKRARQFLSFLSDSDSNQAILLHFATNCDDHLSSSENRDHHQTHAVGNNEQELLFNQVKIGDYIIVKVFTERNRYQHFIAAVTDVPDKNAGFEVKYITCFQKPIEFLFPEVEYFSLVKDNDIVCILSPHRHVQLQSIWPVHLNSKEISNIIDCKLFFILLLHVKNTVFVYKKTS